MSKPKSVEALSVVERFNHHNIHSEALLKRYPDLRIITEGSDMHYYSHLVNPEVDKIQIIINKLSTYVNIFIVAPYKNVDVECSKCDGLIRVNSDPAQIPYLIEHEVQFPMEYGWYGLNFEEVLKSNNFNTSCILGIHLDIVKRIEEHGKNKHKLDLTCINHSIKKLLPFT